MIESIAIGVLNASTSISVLLILSLGIAITAGLMGIINFAHGELMMIGAYTVLVLTQANVPLLLAILVAPIASGFVGLLIEQFVVRWLYGRAIDILLATAGIGMVLSQLATIRFGAQVQSVHIPAGSVLLGEYSISTYRLMLVVIAVCLSGFIYLIFTRTRFGLEARAATLNPEMAMAVGINVAQINRLTFVFSAALAGLAGAVLAPFTSISPSLYPLLMTKAFMAVLVGGPAIVFGTTVSATTLGAVDSTVAMMSTPTVGRIALLGCAVLVLRWFPKGISGSWSKTL